MIRQPEPGAPGAPILPLARVVADNVRRLRDAISAAAVASGRTPGDVTLMAVTKTRTAAEIDAAIAAGIALVGENRVQEAREKRPSVQGAAEWHLIGHLQANKANAAVGLFAAIDAVDSARIAERIAHASLARGMPVDVLVEVNTSGEESKFGVAPEAALNLVGAVGELAGVRLRGLMTVGALSTDERRVRGCFALLRRLRDDAESTLGIALPVLSMGMTGDFPWAIAEGSTLVRIGTAIFGSRPA